MRGHAPELRQCLEERRKAHRLRRLKAGNQAGELIPVRQRRHRDRVKAFRPRSSNAAEAEANPASDPQSRVEQVAQAEQREQHRPRLSNPRRSRTMVGRQHEDWAKSQVPARVDQGNLSHRGATENLSVNVSARRRLPAQLSMSSVAEVRRLDFVNRSPRQLVADPRVKPAPHEKECRARRLSSSSEAARLPIARDRGSRKVGRRDHQKKRHRQGRDNFAAITAVAPGRTIPEPLFCSDVCVKRRAVSVCGRSPRRAPLQQFGDLYGV